MIWIVWICVTAGGKCVLSAFFDQIQFLGLIISNNQSDCYFPRSQYMLHRLVWSCADGCWQVAHSWTNLPVWLIVDNSASLLQHSVKFEEHFPCINLFHILVLQHSPKRIGCRTMQCKIGLEWTWLSERFIGDGFSSVYSCYIRCTNKDTRSCESLMTEETLSETWM